ncbi:SCO family protein [Crateriforma spongiae]|uniref:SCO family protein n=1 Tax=Crateriforma spongiae TaxID=2724528 RepID=UPI0039AF9B9D
MTVKLPQQRIGNLGDTPGRRARQVSCARPGFIAACAAMIVLLGVVMFVGTASAQPLQSGEGVSLNNSIPREVRSVTVTQKLGENIPADVVMTDSSGKSLSTGDLLDGEIPLLITLNYSDCPMLCNVQLNALVQSLDELELKIGKDFRLLSLSIDPTEPTEKVAQTKDRYLQEVPRQSGAAEGWRFCTAQQEQITKLADALGFSYVYDEQSGEYYHPAMLAYVSPDGVIVRYSLDVGFPVDQLKLSIVEAGQGKVGSAVDQFVLWCYSYDPNKNSYVPQAWKLMRLGGFVTVGALVTALLPFWVGRRRRPAGDPANASSVPPGSQPDSDSDAAN